MQHGTAVNSTPRLLIAAADVPTPATGTTKFTDLADGLPKVKDSNGDVVLDVITNTDGEIVGPVLLRFVTEAEMNLVTLLVGEFAIASDTGQTRYGDGVTAGGIPSNMESQYTILCPPIGTPTENGDSYLACLVRAKLLTPQGNALADDNRVKIRCGDGEYAYTAAIPYDTDFVDTEGAGDATIFSFASTFNVAVTCRDLRVSNVYLASADSLTTPVLTVDEANGCDRGVFSHVNSNHSLFQTPGSGVLNMTIIDCSCGPGTCYIDGGGSIGARILRCVLGDDSVGVSDENADFTGLSIQDSVLGTASVLGKDAGSVCTIINTRADFGSYAFLTNVIFEDSLIETGSGTGLYEYLTQNTKRKAVQPDVSETSKDLAAGFTIEWVNPNPTGVILDTYIDLSGLDPTAETFSVAVKIGGVAVPGNSTWSSTKANPTGTTHRISVPITFGTVGVGETFQVEIISDNAGSDDCDLDLTATEMAYI